MNEFQRPCAHCGQLFTTPESQRRKRFCRTRCRTAAWRATQRLHAALPPVVGLGVGELLALTLAWRIGCGDLCDAAYEDMDNLPEADARVALLGAVELLNRAIHEPASILAALDRSGILEGDQ